MFEMEAYGTDEVLDEVLEKKGELLNELSQIHEIVECASDTSLGLHPSREEALLAIARAAQAYGTDVVANLRLERTDEHGEDEVVAQGADLLELAQTTWPVERIPHFPCPACHFRTRLEEAFGSYAICPVCFWEDDEAQELDPELAGGANAVSLKEARENFQKFGATQACFSAHVRKPLDYEMR